ncbi:S-layer homology domain-containing protein [Paenibacillus sp. FSL K6-1096]|uniref:S-layer homology domain-containing protein n=1 Tax=Paenibacillus sp. FSL K6-1096 TaxID=2921460 RepID=UPI0030EC275B
MSSTEEGSDPGQYPSSARTELGDAITTAQAVASNVQATAAQVEQALEELVSAIATCNAAVVPESDKTELNAAIAEAQAQLSSTVEGTDPGQYSSSARTALGDAITTAQAVASNSQAAAAQVEQALEELTAAIATYNAAEVPEADKTELNAAIAEAQAKLAGTVEGNDPGQYPSSARTALGDAITTAQAMADNAQATAAQVEQALEELAAAIATYNAAVVSESDKTALNAAIAEAQAKLAGTVEGNDPGQYPSSVRTALGDAITTAQAVASNAQATTAEVEQALEALVSAIATYNAAVVPESDKTGLNAAIAEAQAKLSSTAEGTDPGQYPSSARTALGDAITTAQAMADNAQATAAQVEQALEELAAAIATYNAAVVSESDKTELNAAIAEAQAKLSSTEEGGDPGQYPSSVRTALGDAITTAQAVASNAQATAAEVEQALEELAAAIAIYNAAVVSESDKTELNTAIAEAQAKLSSTEEGSDPGQYPSSARTALVDAITTAQAVASNSQATAAQVEQARAAIASALAVYMASAVPQPDAPHWESGAAAQVEDRGISHIKLGWPEAQALAGIEGYRIYIGAEARLLAELTGDQLRSYDAVALDPGTRYVFLIRAYNAAGESQGLPVETLTLPDLTALDSQITQAEQRLTDTTEGAGTGQYPAQARAVLAAEIAAAKAVAQQLESPQQDVDAAAAALQQAIISYNQAVIRQVDPPAPPSSGASPSDNAQLKVLQLSADGVVLPLTPGFNAETTSYQVETRATELVLRVEAADAKATMSVTREGDGQRLEPGSIWPLQLGSNRYRITVKAENGMERIYTLTVQRLADEQTMEPKPQAGSQPAQESEPPVAPVFTDTIGHWAEEQIRRAVSQRWVQGYPDQAFRPGQAVTRAEFIVMLVQALRPDAAAGSAPSFSDEHSWGEWAKPSIRLAVELGWIRGYADGSFRPNREISRAEMAVVLARVFGIAASGSAGLPFVDGEAIPAWAQGSVEALYARGIVAGRAGGQFAPAASTTRAEAVVVLLRALD